MGRLAYLRYQELALVFNVTILTILGCAHLIWVSRREQLSLCKVIKSRTDVKVHHSHPYHHTPPPSSAAAAATAAAAARAHADGSSAHHLPLPPSRLPSSLAPPGYSRTVSLMALQRVDSNGGGSSGWRHSTRNLHLGHEKSSSSTGFTGSSSELRTVASAPNPTHSPLPAASPSLLSRLGRLLSQRGANHSDDSSSSSSSSSKASAAPKEQASLSLQPPQNSSSSSPPPPPPPTVGGESTNPIFLPAAAAAAAAATATAAAAPMVSFRTLPPLNEEISQRLVMVDVQVVEEQEDDLLSDGGDVDEYSVGDVAGEASDDEFDYLRDPVSGGLVEVVVVEGEEEEGMREEEDEERGERLAGVRRREWGEEEGEESLV